MFRVKASTREGSGRIIFNFPHSSLLAEKGKTIFCRRGCHTKKQRNYPSFCGILTNSQCNFKDPWCRFIAIRADDEGLKALEDKGYQVRELPETSIIQVGGYKIDASLIGTRSKSSTSAKNALPSGRSHYLMRLAGPIHPDWKTQLGQMGVNFHQTVDQNTYLTEEEEAGNLEIILFDPNDQLTAIDAIRSARANIIKAKGKTIIVFADLKLVPKLAAIPQIREINPYKPPQLHNNVATGIINANILHNDHDLDGNGQIVGIADTGLDTGVNDATMLADFQGRITNIYALGRHGDASDTNGHGTHVAGSGLGDGSNSNGNIRGMSPAASVVFQSIMDNGGGLGGIQANLGVGLFDEERDDGVRIHTNSWGSPVDGAYNANANEADTFAFNNREFLILFSAALLKALMINGVVDMGMGIPDTGQGWGRIDLNNTLFPAGTNRVQFDDTLDNAVATGDIRTYDVFVSSADAPLVVTLVWRDPSGNTIQNRLHLRVIHVDSGVTSTSEPSNDIRNNVQKVVINPPPLGM